MLPHTQADQNKERGGEKKMGRKIKVQRSTLEKKRIMKSSNDTVDNHMSSAFNELMSSEISGSLDWLGSP